MPHIVPFLWFNSNGAEAVRFYRSVFGDDFACSSTALDLPEGPTDSVTVYDLTIFGTRLQIMDHPCKEQMNDTFSLQLTCDGQQEVDYYWDALTADGGQPVACGWLKDRFGLSWQVTPRQLTEALEDPDPERAAYAMRQMIQMTKIIVADLTPS